MRINRHGPRPRSRLHIPFACLMILALVMPGCSLDSGVGAAAPTKAAAAPTAAPPTSTPGSQVAPASPTPLALAVTPTIVATPVGAATAARSTVATEVYKMDGPSVVNITSLAIVRTRQGTSTQPQGLGSGFIIDDQGYIVTNNHVVENAQELSVTFSDGSTVPGELIGRDPDNDLAVVKVDPGADVDGRPVRSLIRPVKLGDSSTLVVGEDVVAIGSPLGLQQTVTTGIVSALRAPGEEVAQGELLLLGGAVQTDAAINPGNSGGPLFNAAGEVIGVNTWGLSPSGGSIGLGFAIPVNVVKRVVPELIRTGCYRHPLVGISTIALSQLGQAAKRELGISATQKGLLVQEVSGGSAEAGLQAGSRTVMLGGEQIRVGGDIIIAIDGQPVNTNGDLRAWVENNKKPGDTITITALRNGQRQDFRVTLGTRQLTVPCRG